MFNWLKKSDQATPSAPTKVKEEAQYTTQSKPIAANVSKAEMDEIHEALKTALEEGAATEAINYACSFLAKGSYENAIIGFETIATTLPDRAAMCHNQIGAAYFFLGNYYKAVQHYLRALEKGFDAALLDYNVWEAAQAQHAESDDSDLIQLYAEKFPTGAAIEQAQEILPSSL